MKRPILTALTATALALSTMAPAPAKAADTKEILGAILGIAAVAAIAKEIKDDRDDRRNRSNRRVHYDDGRYGQFPNRGRHDRWRDSRVLPGQCLRVLDGGRHDGIVFPARCLNNNGVRTRDLPRRCETEVRTRQGRMDVYRARCLADAGWSLPRIAQR